MTPCDPLCPFTACDSCEYRGGAKTVGAQRETSEGASVTYGAARGRMDPGHESTPAPALTDPGLGRTETHYQRGSTP